MRRWASRLPLILVVACMLFGWSWLSVPWRKVKSFKVSTTSAEVVKVLGKPTEEFATRAELVDYPILSDGGYSFLAFPGPKGQIPFDISWPEYNVGHHIRLQELPWKCDTAYWYDLSLSAGILIMFKDGCVSKMYFGGT